MHKGQYISTILRASQTVFSFKDITMLWRDTKIDTATARVNYFVKSGQLYNIRRGLYAKDKNYNKFELATRIFTPSYISFETVLAASGIIFQYYGQIFVASYLSRDINCDNQSYNFKKIKNLVLTNHAGIENKQNYWIATKERAFLDRVYLSPNYYFDNLSALNWEKVFQLLPIYDNKRMVQNVNTYFKDFKSNQ